MRLLPVIPCLVCKKPVEEIVKAESPGEQGIEIVVRCHGATERFILTYFLLDDPTLRIEGAFDPKPRQAPENPTR